MTTTTPATGTVSRTPQLITALICSAVAALAVTALALVVIAGPIAWLQSGGTAADRSMATLLLVIGLAFLAPPTVLMWVSLVRLATQPPRGATVMIGCLRAVGGFILVVALPTMSRSGSIAVIGAVIGVALVFLGTAQLVSSATRAETDTATDTAA